MFFKQHPTAPLPFYVIDPQKLGDADKVSFIEHDLGKDKDLFTFAEKFMDLFGSKMKGVVPQKSKCLQLFALYSEQGRNWKKESDLPPQTLTSFQRIWDPNAPDRCRECGTSLNCKLSDSERKHNDQHYCSEKCRLAGIIEICWKCKRKIDDKSVAPCTFCKTTTGPTNNSKRSLELTTQMWYRGQELHQNHEPAWKSRRRS